jgi:hypothetical protein
MAIVLDKVQVPPCSDVLMLLEFISNFQVQHEGKYLVLSNQSKEVGYLQKATFKCDHHFIRLSSTSFLIDQ